MYALQNQNVEHKIAKKIDMSYLNTNKNNDTTYENNNTITYSNVHDDKVEQFETKPVETTEISDIPSILIPQPQADNYLIDQHTLLNEPIENNISM